MAFNQATWIGPNSNIQSGSSTRLVLVPRAAPACPEAQKPRPTSLRGCLQGLGRESFAHSLLGVASPPPRSPTPKCKALRCSCPAGHGPHSPGPRGHGEPLAVRFAGPLKAGGGISAPVRRPVGCSDVASARIPPRGYLRPSPLPLPAVAWCENAPPGRTGAAAPAAAARAVRGAAGASERWRRAEGVFFPFPPERGFCKPKPKSVSWAGRTLLSRCASGPPGA